MITTEEFDSVYTAYAWANPVDWFVREIRFAFLDNDDTDFDLEELKFVVHNAHKDWKNGKRVLIRCQAGMNRSSVITALVLIREGYTPVEAVNLIRDNRSEIALFNRTFEQWILKQDVKFWQN
jgi:protein-tyrosine phosphatase